MPGHGLTEPTSDAAEDADSAYDDVAYRSAAVVIDRYSTSFGWACRLLGPEVRDHVRAVYALVRVADEIVDDMAAPLSLDERAALLDELEREVDAAVRRGRSTNLVVHAFAVTARRFGIGADLTAPFFASMRTDLTVREHDADSFARYVYGSAEVVGLMCLRVFTGGDEAAYGRLAPGAARLGAAFQKVNFLRDLADDLDDRGRAYFPDYDVDFDDSVRDRLLDDIDADLATASATIVELPRSSRVAVRAAHDLFAELSRRLRATSADELRTRRVRVPDAVKGRLVLSAMVRERRKVAVA
ncbi:MULTISPECIES: squalene/phytoene synthase family protein [Isoptericola]|uniref:Squalene/phytoene synthase family protein n=1 Tax=Isoptericola sediminis TaxID=2733572 RepID=A0A849JXQ6_9MICO|nr:MULTISPECIES: squalene/phytoene synthase family protein [Isoptericola]MDO8143436.1 squalene/phytoene synthase family protein [Isoptericola sp. 178]MDO8147299.1 squalene/phytoene synthase family protein [Isoptericola sp. b515]MDO8150388.1 squalene/phytoene synthase family protein [Isoptericola sp. b408]NNU27364.1 squalene/phytoene synthase family protein [Isoptericola sediminis]